MLDKISNEEVLQLLVYINYCDEIIKGDIKIKDKREIDTHIFKDIFIKHPKIKD